ncbi:MAG TPA: ABC transporter ATP-binding protein [Streptosporangiaceae bacterium]|jgi:peptide/nickel transport system ATP-binding protein|nr:ABC transporter ATP-binding protein [Streptosporangiaceae bacterium]
MSTALEATGLSKDFKLSGGQVLHAVADVSLRLDRGAVVALVGESGSGKSTVARLLAGQDLPTSGEVRLDGQPIDVATRAAFRRYKSEVQLVFQDPFASLNPIHTVRHHLERPVRLHWQTPAVRSAGGRPETALRRQAPHGRPGSKAEVGKEVDELLEQVRLTPAGQFASKYPHELSGGQRQRVSFARALAAHPAVLLADEPVSMLDVSIRLEMLRLLDDLRQRLRLAMLYITHDIASARYFSDEILVMYAGQIVERGPAEELTQHPAHPYTQLLVASAPDPDNLGSSLRGGAPVSRRIPEVAGQAPSGCPFSSRCPFADDHCRQENPPPQPVSASRSAACWRLDVAAPDVISNQ